MTIETKIDDLIAALDRNTAALAGAKTAGNSFTTGMNSPSQQLTPPAAVKATKKPAKSEEQVVAESVAKREAQEIAADEGPTLAQVKKAVDSLLKANKRDAAIKLLASFGSAKSATGIVEQGAEVMAQFIAKADDILLGA
jgi:alpha-galactosidase/6-phospho-beta-glucosidase family protein